jgi:integrase
MGKADEERWQQRLRSLGLNGKVPEALTERVLEAVRTHPTGERYKLRDGEVPNLVLQVSPDGGASFLLYYRVGKTKLTHKIATAGAMPLEAVRKLARSKLEGLGRGIDPGAVRREAVAEAERAKHSTVGAYLSEVYGPLVLAHRKDGGTPKKPEDKPSGTHARLVSSWKPLLEKPLRTLSRTDIEGVLAARKKLGKAAGTLLRDWAAFRALLADAVDRNALAAIPMARRPEPIRMTRGNERVRWLGKHDTEDVIAKKTDERSLFTAALDKIGDVQGCTGDFLRFACRLAISTGLRRGEIVRLNQKMLNLRARKITLPPEVTKSNKQRLVSLNDDALGALSAWPMRGTGGELCPGDPVVWEDRITQQGWPALCAAAQLDDLHFHDLRHDFAVRLLRSGATLEQVRDALGHASITQTEKYAHVMPGDVHKAVLAMARG